MELKPTELILEKFRNFENVSIPLGHKITVISGVNGVGKSNILSLIASGSGINKKSFSGSNFQPEFSDFFNIDENENYQDYKIFLKYESDNKSKVVTKRLSFKNDTKTNRGIRIIPRATNKFEEKLTVKDVENKVKKEFNIGGAARINIPTIYLSLSRLYPLGEKKGLISVNKVKKKNDFNQDDIKQKYTEWYNYIIPNSIENRDEILKIDKKVSPRSSFQTGLKGIPILSQSIGQDNIGNIISALIEIYQLSKEQYYKGAILCIDEVDVSLHPDTQIKLLELLDKLCNELSLQVVVSTHSLTILKESLRKQKKDSMNFKVIYLKNPSAPSVMRVNDYNALEADMFAKLKFKKNLVKIYFEDEMSEQLFLEHIKAFKMIFSDIKNNPTYIRNSEKISNIEEYKEKFLELEEIMDIKDKLTMIVTRTGCDELIKISKVDNYFKSVIIMLDGDARIREKSRLPQLKDYLDKDFNPKFHGLNDREETPNIIFAPGYFPPESYIYSILHKLIVKPNDYSDFWRGLDDNIELSLFTPDKLRNIFSELKENYENKKIKNIFEKKDTIDLWKFVKESNLISYYYNDFLTIDILLEFIRMFRDAYKMTFSNLNIMKM